MTTVRTHHHPAPRQGTALVWVVMSLAALVAVVALNVDGGRLMDERRRVQTVTDAAALAAGAELYAQYWDNRGADPTGRAAAAAVRVATANGLPPEAVAVQIPPATGAYAGQAGHAEIVVSTTVSTSFGRAITGESLPVSARSVGRGLPVKIGIIALRKHGAGAFRNESLALVLLNKPLIVNSDDPAAAQQVSFGAVLASRIDVTGGFTNPGRAIALARIRTGVRPTLDPLAFLPVPSGGEVQSAAPRTIDSLLPVVLRPGVYQGGLKITGISVVTMLPGVYVMQGGGFQVDGLATVAGLGTMVYNTTSPSYAPGPIRVAGLGKVVMTAPLGGTYQGINFFQNRAMTEPVEVAGAGLTTITGTVYAASAPAVLSGSAAVGLDVLGGAYVVDSMTVQGVGSVTLDLKLNPPRVPDVRVVE